jgi:hypothetical protein
VQARVHLRRVAEEFLALHIIAAASEEITLDIQAEAVESSGRGFRKRSKRTAQICGPSTKGISYDVDGNWIIVNIID